MELATEMKEFLIQTAKALQGSEKRVFMARTVRILGEGGQRLAEEALGWNRGTMRKGEHELKSGMKCVDAFQPPRGESAVKSTCQTCWTISLPSWMGKVKQIPSFARTASIRD